MIAWASISQMYPGKRRASGKASAAALRLAEAYIAVFIGKPTITDQQIVLADLASHSWFFAAPDMDTSDAQLRHVAGARELYARIHTHLTLTDEMIRGLMQASRVETQASTEELELA